MRRLLLVPLIAACALPVDDWDGDGFSLAAGDCDDLDASVNPDAREIDDDGIDQDCDGIDPFMRAIGAEHSCTLEVDGTIACNGDNSRGQLNIPQDNRVWVQIAAGENHTCALDDMAFVECWGDDRWGQSSPPTPGPFTVIDAGGNYSIGQVVGRPALCWGLCVDAQQ